MGTRLWRTIITRLTAPPLALKVHAGLVLAAAFILADTNRPWWWATVAIVAILLWPLLRGSRFVWWVHLVGIGFVLFGALRAYFMVLDGPPGYEVFIGLRFVVVVTALVPAWLLLLHPAVRAYCRTDPVRRNAVVFALGVWLLSGFPSLAFGVHVPSDDVLERTPGAVFVGGDRRGPVAFYVSERGSRICLVALAPMSTSRSCIKGSDQLLEYPSPVHAADALVDVVPEEIERVEIVMPSETRVATLLESRALDLDVYYVLDAPWREIVRVVGYDADGKAIYRAEEV